MSRHIEYAQKADIYAHFQRMDLGFYKRHRTGDLMNRISEDVSRVRMFTGPALMYFLNLFTIILFCVISMYRRDPTLTFYVLSPLPILAFIMYRVNNRINRLSEAAQGSLS
jgi:ATP-binding cassette subfamily B protein